MKGLLVATAVALTIGFAAVWVAPDDERTSNLNSDLPSPAEAQLCMSRFEDLDKNSDGGLTGDEFDNLKTAVKNADRNKDGEIRSVEYQAACATGVLMDGDIKS
jgi:hypothetical protein